jgi:hypothetical protein
MADEESVVAEDVSSEELLDVAIVVTKLLEVD